MNKTRCYKFFISISRFKIPAFLIFSCLSLYSLIFIYQGINKDISKSRSFINAQATAKLILFGNDLYGKLDWGFPLGTTDAFKIRNCEITNCIFTANQKDIKNCSAVLFHKIRGSFPNIRLPHQRWIYLDHEPPYGGFTETYANIFNWTQTYRYDADLYMPYEYVCKREKPIKIDFKTLVATKTKKIAWFVGNCHPPSKRDTYVQELSKHIDVDVFGACAPDFGQKNQCARTGIGNMLGHDCYKMIEQKYKFYLAFESCFDSGYLTEKYYNIMRYNVVPIVRGDGDYSRVVPNSFINTKDFSSPKELAEYLHRLDRNNTKYIRYLKNREKYALKSEGFPCTALEKDVWCKLCAKLNSPNEPYKTYGSLKDWYGKCREPTDI